MAVLGLVTLTTACSDVQPKPAALSVSAAEQLVDMCLSQTGAPGVYNWRKDGTRPDLRPIANLGGTEDGASMMNACVRQNVVLFEQPAAETEISAPADPVVVAPTPAPLTGQFTGGVCPSGVTGLYRGNLVC